MEKMLMKSMLLPLIPPTQREAADAALARNILALGGTPIITAHVETLTTR